MSAAPSVLPSRVGFSDRLLTQVIRFFNAEWSGALLAVVILSLAFGIVSGGDFFAPGNMMQIVISGADIGLIAAGMTIVILTAGIDLSVGSILVLVTSVIGYVAAYFGLDPVSAILVGLLAGLAVGLLQGSLIAHAGMPAFIVTLAGLSIWRGLANFLTKAQTSPPLPDFFKFFGSYNPLQGFREPLPAYMAEDIKTWGFWERLWEWVTGDKFDGLAGGQIFEIFWLTGFNGVQAAFFIHVGFFVLIALVLSNMRLGRYMYAIGSNELGARQAGINTKFYILLAYVICALCCSTAGVVRLGLSSTATPLLGTQYELLAIAAVVIGGTSLFGGRGTIWGTFLGVLLLKIINNGFIQSGLAGSSNEGTFVQMMLTGTIILIAVGMDIVRQSGSPLAVRRFLLGASSACIILVALVPGFGTFGSGVALFENNVQQRLLAESETVNASAAEEIAAAKAEMDAAKADYAPFEQAVKDARRPVNAKNSEIRKLLGVTPLDDDALLAARTELADLESALYDARFAAAETEVAFQKARLAFNQVNRQRIRLDQKQTGRILDNDKIADQQARFGANAPLLLALVLTTIAGIWATLKMGRPVELAFSALLVASCVFAVVAGKLSLVPLLILGAVLLAGAQFVLMLAERAKALADMRMA